MKSINRAHIVCGAVLALCASAGTALAFTEPIASPAGFSSPKLLNVSSVPQTKAGDLTLENIKALNGIGLGGETRASWLPAGQSCSWEGWRCDCKSDSSSFVSLAITFGVKCAGGRVEDAGLFGLAVSSKTKSCGAKAPAPCTQGIYTRNNQDSGTFLESATAGLSGGAKVAADIALAPVKAAVAVGAFAVKTTVAVVSAATDIVVQGVKTTFETVKSIGGGVVDAVKGLASDVSKLALDPKTNPIELVVGTGVAAVKAAVAVGTTVVKAAVTAVTSAATTVVKAATKVVKALCFWC